MLFHVHGDDSVSRLCRFVASRFTTKPVVIIFVHWAYNVTFASGMTKVVDPDPAYWVPLPFAAVVHATNVKPSLRVKVFAGTVMVEPAGLLPEPAGALPLPPFASNAKVRGATDVTLALLDSLLVA